MTLMVFLTVLLAAVLHAGWNFVAKQAAGNLGAMWLGVWLGAILSWPWAFLVHRVEPLTVAGLPYIIATGILHAWYFGFVAKAYMTGDISVVYPVARGTGVAGTAVVAWLCLGEHLSYMGLLGIIAVCAGTGLIGWQQRAQPGQATAYGHALLVGATIIGYASIDKLAVGQVHPVIYISGMFSLAALCLTPYVLRTHRAACLYAYQHLKLAIAVIGVGSLGTYLMILFTLRLGPVSYIIATREFAVVIGSLLGVFLLKERLTMRKGMGIAAITLGLVLIKTA